MVRYCAELFSNGLRGALTDLKSSRKADPQNMEAHMDMERKNSSKILGGSLNEFIRDQLTRSLMVVILVFSFSLTGLAQARGAGQSQGEAKHDTSPPLGET